MRFSYLSYCFLTFLILNSCSGKDEKMKWDSGKGKLDTPWTRDVTPELVLPEYPRPQMTRADWMNLNGLWKYAITDSISTIPDNYQGDILVPFPVESTLSGVMKQLQPDQRLWYHRSIKLPRAWKNSRILLHFGSVDWQATVYLNGRIIAEHKGGYDPFSIDITGNLKPGSSQDLIVKVWDPTDLGRTDTINAPRQPSGKQRSIPYGTEYSQVSGIWKTVWIEPVPASRIEKFDVVTDIDREVVLVKVNCSGKNELYSVTAKATGKSDEIFQITGKADTILCIEIPSPRLWSPDSPFLYKLKLTLLEGDKAVDEVKGYFGMRKISIDSDDKDINRIYLNNTFVFQAGLLDQGYWPDGLYTAPTDSALRFDIALAKKFGFNLLRKHCKVEPDRWYYWCDKMGMLVWQDMTPKFPAAGYGKNEIYTSKEDASQFEFELEQMVEGLRNHPSIVMWILFNETWGQYDTKRLVNRIRELDSTRLVNSASGCENFGVGDIIDGHQYPGPGPGPTKSWPSADQDEWQWEVKAMPDKTRAAVVGEYGGTFLFYPDHSWNNHHDGLKPFLAAGYPLLETSKELTANLETMLKTLYEMIHSNGISAGIYTQLTDVEVECNGLITYDRRIIKADTAKIRNFFRRNGQ